MGLHAALTEIPRREVLRPYPLETGKNPVHLGLRSHGRVSVAEVVEGVLDVVMVQE
jgi:hypothetical protein